CTLKVDSFKTSDSTQGAWIIQELTVYGTGGIRGESSKRIMQVNEVENSVMWKSDWIERKSLEDMSIDDFSENFFINYPYLSNSTYDLDNIYTQGNFIVNSEVTNNPLDVGCTLRVNRFKTSESAQGVWVTQ